MLSIQIDTESHLPLFQQYQIVLLCKPYEIEFSIMYVFIDAVRLSDTLEYAKNAKCTEFLQGFSHIRWLLENGFFEIPFGFKHTSLAYFDSFLFLEFEFVAND